MAISDPIEYEGYKIRPQETTVKDKTYERHVVELEPEHGGGRKRRSFNSLAKAKAAIREHNQRKAANEKARAILQKQIGDSIATVMKHYVNTRVDPETATDFWAIRPATNTTVLKFRKVG